MPSPYQVFAQKARERFEKKRQTMAFGKGVYQFTLHAQYKMRQYGLSEQKVKSVIRNPKRREEGIVPKTVAVMQPVSVKRDAGGKETWRQEIWVMFRKQSTKNLSARFAARRAGQAGSQQKTREANVSSRHLLAASGCLKIISAWRYPGVSPKRNPIPEEILQEIRAVAL